MVQSRVTMAVKIKKTSFWQDVPFKGSFYTSLALNVLTITFIVAGRTFLPPVAPLLYGRPEGSSQLVPSLWLSLAPFIALILTIINIFLIKPVKDTFMRQILVISTLLISLLTTITVFKIIFLVGLF